MATAEASSTALTEPAFRTVRRGFDPEEVRAHLDRVANEVRDLESRLRQREADLQQARGERDTAGDVATPDPYNGVSTHVADLLRGFDHDVERLRVKSAAEAERIQTEARVQAQMELVKARLEADRIRTEVLALRSSKFDELRTMRDHLESSLKELETALENEPSEDHVVVLGEVADRAPEGADGPSEPTATRPELAV